MDRAMSVKILPAVEQVVQQIHNSSNGLEGLELTDL